MRRIFRFCFRLLTRGNFVAKSDTMGILENKSVKDKIVRLRGQDVILDFAVAEIYGVETKEINEKQEVVKNFDRLDKLKYSSVLQKRLLKRDGK